MEEVLRNVDSNRPTSTRSKRQLEVDEKDADNSVLATSSRDLLTHEMKQSKKLKRECGCDSLKPCEHGDITSWSNPESAASKTVKLNPNRKQIDRRRRQMLRCKKAIEKHDKGYITFVVENTKQENPSVLDNADKNIPGRENMQEDNETHKRASRACCIII